MFRMFRAKQNVQLHQSVGTTELQRQQHTVSPGSSLFRSPLFSVKYLSLTLPPHPLNMKLTIPLGVISIEYLPMLWFLQFKQVCALANLSINISKQSTMTVQSGQCFRKSIGSVLRRTVLSGHIIICLSLTKRTLTTEATIYLYHVADRQALLTHTDPSTNGQRTHTTPSQRMNSNTHSSLSLTQKLFAANLPLLIADRGPR